MKKKRASPARFLAGAMMILFAAAFARKALTEQDNRLYVLAAAVPGVLLLGSSRTLSRLSGQDRPVLLVSLTLIAWSVLIRTEADPDAGISLSVRCSCALLLPVAGSLCLRMIRPSVFSALIAAAAALAAAALPLFADVAAFPMGYIAVSFMMIAFVIILSLRAQYPAMLLALAGTALFLAEKDPASAAVWSITFLFLFWAFSGHPAILATGAGAVILAGFLFSDLFAASGQPSFFSGIAPGWIGLESSDPFLAGAASSDAAPFLWITVRYGWIVAACVLLLYPVIILRGSALARASRSRLHGMFAMGAVLIIGLTAVAALLSDFGIWSVSGIFLPGLSGDLSSLSAFLFLSGILGGVSVRNQADLDEDEHLSQLAE